jgi:putative nucleotidyltransferase with HDIG domain
MVQKRTEKIKRVQENMMLTIARIIGTKDPYIAGHHERVSQLAVAIAREMLIPKEQIEGIRVTSMVHDIGKINVPAEILSKPGKLTDIEFGLIQQHTTTGYEVLKTIDYPWPVAEIVYQHHENIDGTGYPRGLNGEDILIEAQIIRVADVVEAMSSHRPYRAALGLEAAIEELFIGRGKKYNQEAVDACVKIFKEGKFKFKEN